MTPEQKAIKSAVRDLKLMLDAYAQRIGEYETDLAGRGCESTATGRWYELGALHIVIAKLKPTKFD